MVSVWIIFHVTILTVLVREDVPLGLRERTVKQVRNAHFYTLIKESPVNLFLSSYQIIYFCWMPLRLNSHEELSQHFFHFFIVQPFDLPIIFTRVLDFSVVYHYKIQIWNCIILVVFHKDKIYVFLFEYCKCITSNVYGIWRTLNFMLMSLDCIWHFILVHSSLHHVMYILHCTWFGGL